MASVESPKPKGRQLLKMRVAEIRDYTPRIRELFIECIEPAELPFRCGQFMMLHVPAEPKTLLRAYSMASGDQNKSGFRLIFNYVDEGPASLFVWNLKGGETLDFTGPFGRLFFKEPPTEQIVFLNTGSGISQHFSYMESNIEKYPQLTYRLLFGVRTEKDIYYQGELERLKKHFKSFEYDFVLSRPSAEWKGKKGYVQDHIADFKYLETPTTFYLCGNGGMIKDVKSRLGEQGFDATRILSEAFD
jgi:CDP-4-dehydro-6-deoxyglucose reductase